MFYATHGLDTGDEQQCQSRSQSLSYPCPRCPGVPLDNRELSFLATHVNRKWPFYFDGFAKIVSQIVSIRVKKLSNTNFIASRLVKREKTLLPVDVRRSKTSLLKLPNCKGNADSGNEIAGVISDS